MAELIQGYEKLLAKLHSGSRLHDSEEECMAGAIERLWKWALDYLMGYALL